jgi:ATP-binding protein involved in chromosome partitioning
MRIVAIASGKGGVGKSTVSLHLATALADRGVATGLLDADLYGPDLAAMVGLTRRRRTKAVEVWRRGSAKEQPVETHGIKLMSAQFLIGEDQPLALSQPMATLLLQRFRDGIDWGDTDVLLVDLPPGTADLQQLVARHLGLAGVVIVVTPQEVAHLDAKKALTMFRSSRVSVLGGVENMAGLTCPCCDTRIDVFPACPEHRTIWATGVERLVSIPLDPNGPPSAPFADLAGRLLDRLRADGADGAD